MRVLLVNPKSKLPIDTRTSPPLGLAYLAAVAEQRGDVVRVHDGDVEDVSLEAIIRQFAPEVVGITANTTQIMAAWRDAELVKSICDAAVVLGGPHPTTLPEESAAKPGVDVVVRSEGEVTWLELLSAFDRLFAQDPASGSPITAVLQPIAGITYRDEHGAPVSTPDRPPIPAEELDKMPFPAWHLFSLDLYTNLQPTVDHVEGRSLPILTSRGCPYRCSYCSQIGPRRWRARSAESVVAEWRWLVQELGAAEIGVLDDSFNIDRQRVLDICGRLVDEGLNEVPWIMINGIRANIADEEVLGAMKRCRLHPRRLWCGERQPGDPGLCRGQAPDTGPGSRRFQSGPGGGHGDHRLFHRRAARRDRGDDGRHHPLCLRAGPGGGQFLHRHPLSRHRDVRNGQGRGTDPGRDVGRFRLF